MQISYPKGTYFFHAKSFVIINGIRPLEWEETIPSVAALEKARVCIGASGLLCVSYIITHSKFSTSVGYCIPLIHSGTFIVALIREQFWIFGAGAERKIVSCVFIIVSIRTRQF
jgi:hypothetical protein